MRHKSREWASQSRSAKHLNRRARRTPHQTGQRPTERDQGVQKLRSRSDGQLAGIAAGDRATGGGDSGRRSAGPQSCDQRTRTAAALASAGIRCAFREGPDGRRHRASHWGRGRGLSDNHRSWLRPHSLTFNVLSVISGTAFYGAVRNHDVDGGMNGTTVTVKRR